MAPANGQLRIKPQKLFQHIDELLTNNQPSFNYKLVEDFKPHSARQPVVPEKIKPQPATTQKAIPQLEPADVIDLHIENLASNTRGMSNADILLTQLSALETQLRIAINSRQQRLIIIHGLGKGKLRDEVHRLLADTPEVKTYSNEWMPKYGFGATEVWFVY